MSVAMNLAPRRVTGRLTTAREFGVAVTRKRKRTGASIASTRRPMRNSMSLNTNEDVTIRFSRPDDAAKIARLAQLDSARPPQGQLLMAEVAGELRAALPVDGGAPVADPFHHTLGLVSLLEVRRRQLRRTGVTRTSKRCDRAARAERPSPDRFASREYELPVVRELPSLPGAAVDPAETW
jgi:hypothetical protein